MDKETQAYVKQYCKIIHKTSKIAHKTRKRFCGSFNGPAWSNGPSWMLSDEKLDNHIHEFSKESEVLYFIVKLAESLGIENVKPDPQGGYLRGFFIEVMMALENQ